MGECAPLGATRDGGDGFEADVEDGRVVVMEVEKGQVTGKGEEVWVEAVQNPKVVREGCWSDILALSDLKIA